MKLLNVLLTPCLVLGMTSVPAAECDSECLTTHLQHYLFHMQHQDVAELPFSNDLKSYENAVATRPGEGSWKSIESFPVKGQIFVDAPQGQIVYYGATKLKTGIIGSLFIRMKVENDEITETEMFTKGAYTREGESTEGLLEPDILYTAVVPSHRLSSREELVKIVDLYMDGISKHDGSVFPASGRCDRYQAGNKFTNRYIEQFDKTMGGCQSSMDSLQGQTVVDRRFPVVDEELGIVAVFFIIPHAERDPQNATNVAEIFKIVDGKVRSIEEFSFVGTYPPFSGFAE